MKKLFTTLVAFLIFATTHAQFFEKVDYAGALSPDPSKDWTKGWAQWNPKTTVYSNVTDTVTLSSATGEILITGLVELDPAKVYLLRSLVIVKQGGHLIIPGGTVIRGSANLQATPKQYATIVVERGGLIDIQGTINNPVVMTSSKGIGLRDRGDWGGLVICGKAVNNQSADVQVEGFNNITLNPTTAKYGGIDDNDNSGTIQYLRIEFGGLAFEPNKEINGLTLASVGRNTRLNNIQVSYSGDDAFEWFGGTVNCKNIIAYKTTDDDFDTDFGYRGAVQFGIAVKDTAYFDLSWNAPSGASTSETFESDNDASGSGKLPLTAAVFSNITCVGPVPAGMSWDQLTTAQKGAFRRGVRIRRNSRLSIINSIFMGYRNFVMFDGDSTLTAAGVKSRIVSDKGNLFRNNYIYSTKAAAPKGATNTGLAEISTNGNILALDSWIRNSVNNNTIDTSLKTKSALVNSTSQSDYDFRPVDSTISNFNFSVLNSFGVFSKVFVTKKQPVVTYPNPSNQGFTITSAKYTLVNSVGTVVSQGQNYFVNTESLSDGIYYLVTEKGTQTIIVKH